MSAKDESEILRRRAIGFLETAEHLLGAGTYDLACFNAEQGAQLYCKAALLEVAGDYPRKHSIVELLNTLSEATDLGPAEFASANREALRLLDTAYLTSRYFAVEFTREDAESLISTAGKVIRIVDEAREAT